MRLVILFDNFGPYHLARLAAAQNLGRKQGIEVMGMEIVGRSPDYAWVTCQEDKSKKIITLFPMHSQWTPETFIPPQVSQRLAVVEAFGARCPGYPGISGRRSLGCDALGQGRQENPGDDVRIESK